MSTHTFESVDSPQEIKNLVALCDCGAEYPKGGKFCVNCGKPVQAKTDTIHKIEIPQKQSAKPVKKSGKQFLKHAAVFLLILTIGTVCGYFAYELFGGGIRKELLVEQKIVPGEQDQTVSYKDEISVTVPFGLIDTEETLSISSVRGFPVAEGVNINKAYDVAISNVKEIDGFIEITMSYDPAIIPSGMSAARVLTCMYFNEEKQAWEPVPFTLDETNRQITIYTSHLSIFAYGAASEVQPGPMMKIHRVPSPGGHMLDEQRVKEILEMYGRGGSPTQEGITAGWDFVNEWFGIISQPPGFAELVLEFEELGGINEVVGYMGFAFALVQTAINIYDGKTNEAALEFVKGVSNLGIGLWGPTAVNVAFIGVFFFEYALDKFATTAISQREQIYVDAYNLYYRGKRQRENINAVWWYRNLKGLVRQIENPADSREVVEKFLHDYVWEFWKDESRVAFYMHEATGGRLRFTGLGGISERLKRDISNNHLAEIVHRLHEIGIFDRINRELRNEAQHSLWQQLNRVKNRLNSEYQVRVVVKHDSESEKDVSLEGLNVRFVTTNDDHKGLWTGKTNRNGVMDFKFTLLGFVNAGRPEVIEVEVPSPTNKGEVEVFSGKLELAPRGKLTTVEIIIRGAPLSVITTSLPDGTVGVRYTASLSASGGRTPYSWSLVGSLPPGLSLSPGGVISGTPASAGTFSFTVQVRDSSSPALTASRALSMEIIIEAPKPTVATPTPTPTVVTPTPSGRAGWYLVEVERREVEPREPRVTEGGKGDITITHRLVVGADILYVVRVTWEAPPAHLEPGRQVSFRLSQSVLEGWADKPITQAVFLEVKTAFPFPTIRFAKPDGRPFVQGNFAGVLQSQGVMPRGRPGDRVVLWIAPARSYNFGYHYEWRE